MSARFPCFFMSLWLASACAQEPTSKESGVVVEPDMMTSFKDMAAVLDASIPKDLSPADGGGDVRGVDQSAALDAASSLDAALLVDVSTALDMRAVACVPPEVGEQTEQGRAADGWRWVKRGRVFPEDPTDLAAGDGDFDPTLIPEGEGYRVYFVRKRQRVSQLWTSRSPDGMAWEDPVRVEGVEGGNYPAALRTPQGGVKLWFGSGSFDMASSEDGVVFGGQEERVLSPADTGPFGQAALTYPSVQPAQAGLGYRMWFTGFDGQQLRVGMASSADGRGWVAGGEAVLSRREGSWFDNAAVGQPEVRRIGERWYMWYGGYDTSKTNPGPWRIGLARSAEGEVWERMGVSVPLSEMGDDMWSTRDPAVVQRRGGEGWLMMYVGMRSDSKYRLLLATSEVCLGS